MKKNYWYKDNWYGDINYFETIGAARESAQKESGVYNITIYGINGYKETVKTQGIVYP